MTKGLYFRLAFEGVKKNKRLYIPYLLTCGGMAAMYYIIIFLQGSEAVTSIRGYNTLSSILWFGSWVMAIFACIFLFYTNSFLMRRRKKEFGLYNILGMGKRHIGVILLCEALMTGAFSLVLGLIAGIGLSKLAELGLINIMHSDVNYTLSLSPVGIIMTAAVFGGIFLLLLLNSLRQVRFSGAMALLKSESSGEKPPKGNLFLGLLGLVVLGLGYFIAVTADNPVRSIYLFFIAVVFVIIGTYLVMIAGSVMFCRLLQKKKSYYYKANHFVSVSSMVYRMKRNGAGLASICILATMVLVMISSTVSLYSGSENALNTRYPREMILRFDTFETEELPKEKEQSYREAIDEFLSQQGVVPENINDYGFLTFDSALNKDGAILTGDEAWEEINGGDFENALQIVFVSLEDYNRVKGDSLSLEEGEVYVYADGFNFDSDRLELGGDSLTVKGRLSSFIDMGDIVFGSVFPTLAIAVPDLGYAAALEAASSSGKIIWWTYQFDTGLDKDKQFELYSDLYDEFSGTARENYGFCQVESRAVNRDDYYSIYGGLFYLGIVLSIVFLFAAVLIIYYKQISEGYEDCSRFEIMQKVGMTKGEIRKSINSQLLTVFFLPPGLAALHLTFAFSIIQKMLALLGITNVPLFAAVTAISFAVFGLFYLIVYRITSNAYYNIVSGGKEDG